jgi:hypothetical protein
MTSRRTILSSLASLPFIRIGQSDSSFSWALEQLKAGHKVARKEWNGYLEIVNGELRFTFRGVSAILAELAVADVLAENWYLVG